MSADTNNLPPANTLPPQTHSPLAWRMVIKNGQSFIYADKDDLVCVVMKKFSAEVAPANAEFIVRACNHHHDLVRLVKAAAYTLADGCDEHVWPGLGVSPVSAKEFCRQATELLHTAEKRR